MCSLQAYKPPGFCVPLMPLVPAGSIILNTFLMGALQPAASKTIPKAIIMEMPRAFLILML